MKKLLLCAVIILAVNWQGKADDFEASATKFLELSNSVEPTLKMMDQMLRTMSPSMINQMHQQFTDQGKVIKRDDVVELIQTYREQVIVRFGEAMVPLLVSEMRKLFTVEELKEVIKVMETPAFQTYSKKVPDIMASGQKVGEQLGAKLGQEVMLELLQNNPKFQ